MIKLLLFLFSSVFFFQVLFAQTPTTSFAPWKNNAKGAYSIIHDDFGSSSVPGIENYADTIAFNRGVKITFGAITSACDANDWVNANRMISHGHEVMNHTHNHYCAYDPGWCETQTWANYATELDQSTNLIQTHTSVYPRFFIWPYDLHTTGSKAHLRDNLNYYGARGGTQDQTLNVNQLNNVTITDFFSLNFSVFAPTTNITQLNGLVDLAIAQQKWGMRELHGVGDASWGSVPVVNYRAHLDYVRSKMLTNDIWMATATEVTTYKMQAQNFIPTTTYSAPNQEIRITWNSPAIDLTDLRSNVTLNVNLDGLTGYTYIYQNNVQITQYTVASGVLSFNVFPHQGEITILNAPLTTPQPGDFTVSTATVCQGQTGVTYTVPDVSGTTYTWTYSGLGVNIVGGTNTVTVNYSASATSGTLSVVANNGAGNSIPRTIDIMVNSVPAQPSAFTTSSTVVCSGENNVGYVIPAQSDVTYNWSYTGLNASIAGSTNSVQISFAGNATSGDVQVSTTNMCGTSASRDLPVTVNTVPAQPSAFTTSSTVVCSGENNVGYVIPAQSDVTYNWSYTGLNASIAGSTNSVQISFAGNATSGDVQVSTTNMCGTSTPRILAVVVNSVPVALSGINGQDEVCRNTAAQLYTTNLVAGVTYAWSYTGSDVTITQNVNEASLLIGASPSGGMLSVVPSNQCGDGPTVQKNITITSAPMAPISFVESSNMVIQGNQDVAYSTAPVSTLSAWSYTGSDVTINANGNVASLDFGMNASSGILSVKNLNACGEESSSLDFAIQVSPITSNVDRAFYLGVRVYPNPFNDQLNIDLPTNLSAQRLSIYSSEGLLMYQKELYGIGIPNDLGLNDLNFPSGLYLLSIQCAGETLLVKLVRE